MNLGEVTAVTFALQAFVTLFVIMDPPGATPIFLGLVSEKSPATRRRLAWQAAAVSLIVITSFALFGRLVTFVFKYFTRILTSRWRTLITYRLP